LLGSDLNLVHANFLTADEFRVIANHGASISITPEVEMQMGLGIPPTGAVLAARGNLNIGTDVVTGVSTDMFTQMRFLLQTHRALVNDTFHQRETMPDRLSMTVRQVLEHATIRSAQCIGLDRQIGSLTPGKQADLMLLRKIDINMRAAADPVASIVLHAGVSLWSLLSARRIPIPMPGGAFIRYPCLAGGPLRWAKCCSSATGRNKPRVEPWNSWEKPRTPQSNPNQRYVC
jgi:5-methylthioadenosine/S-adenosylhomocysteine deaminase